jgi:hypothetical protein
MDLIIRDEGGNNIFAIQKNNKKILDHILIHIDTSGNNIYIDRASWI